MSVTTAAPLFFSLVSSFLFVLPLRQMSLFIRQPFFVQALILLLADDDDALVMGAWRGAEALLASVPKEEAAGHVAALRDAFSGARERQRRKRRGGDLQLRGLTLPPKALAPFVPIYLAGVLQVCLCGGRAEQ